MKSWQLEKTGREHLHLVEESQPQPALAPSKAAGPRYTQEMAVLVNR